MPEQRRNTQRRAHSQQRPDRARANASSAHRPHDQRNQAGPVPHRPATPAPSPAERTLRSSEQINRIREQGAKRTQVEAPKQPVHEAPKKRATKSSASELSRAGSKRTPVSHVTDSRRSANQGTAERVGRKTQPHQTAARSTYPSNRGSFSSAKRQPKPKGRGRSAGQKNLVDGIYADTPQIESRSASHRNSHTQNAKGRAYSAPKRQKHGSGARKLAVAAVVLLALLVGIGTDSFVNGNKIYPGVSIGDVDVAGLTKDEAIDRVSSEYSQRVATNVATFFTSQENLENPKSSDSDSNIEEQISYEESLSNRTQWTVPGSAVEATLDVDSLVDQAFEAGREEGGVFGRIKAALFGWNVELACSFNETELGELADEMTATMGEKRVNYDISVNNGVASVTDGHDGNEVTLDWLTDHLNDTYLGTDKDTKTVLETQHLPLQVSERDAQKVADTVNASIAAGATFSYEDQTWNASSSDLGGLIATELKGDGGHWTLTPKFDESKTKNALLSSLHSNVDSNGLQVTFNKDDAGQISVSSNAKGSAPVADDVLDQLNSTFFVGETRTQAPQISVPSADIPSSLSFEDAKSFGLITEVSSFTTQYSSGNEARVNNIHTAADLLSNSIAKANGGTWSFNDTAGEATPDKGYQSAGAIVGGEYSDAIGGGICQVATTVFNSVYCAGYPVEKRYNHSLYIESYPKGRDAAIAYPDLDLVWKNDTSSDVLLVMSYTSTSVTATLWGVNPGYQVSTEYGDWQKGQAYSTVYKTDNTVASGTEYVETTGVDGSSITIVRTVKDHDGKILHQDSFTSNYAPKNKVIVKGAA